MDLFVRELTDDLDRVLDLGEALREAQEAGSRDRLRELTGQRRTVLAEVARAAAERAEDAGQRVGDGALEEVQQTLQAALASPEAAAAVRTGRLVRALDADGLDPVDLDGAVAGGAPGALARRKARTDEATEDRDDADERRRAKEREARIADARRRATAAARAARDAAADAEDRAQDVEDLRKRLSDLQDRVDAAERAQREAEDAASDAHDAADEAAAEVERLTADG